MDRPLNPTAQAAELRARAAGLAGDDRAYCLWLAAEWDKSAARHGGGHPIPDDLAPASDQGHARRRAHA